MPALKPDDTTNVNKAFNIVTRVIKDSGVEDISGVGLSSIAIEKGLYRNKMLLHHYPGKGSGFLWKFLGKEPHALAGLDLLPANTALAIFSDLDVPLLLSLIHILLRRLRQRVKQAGVCAARHEKFPRAFGRGLEERRCFDFEKALFIHENARGRGHFAAQAEVARHFGPAQIEVAIFEAQFLVHLARGLRVVHRERQHFGDVEHFKFLHHDFHFAGGDFGIVRAAGTLADLSLIHI